MTNSKPSARKRQSAKQPAKLPLTKHPKGYWCKKIKGKLHYFGKVEGDEDGQKALAKYLDAKDEILAGRKPSGHRSGGLTVADAGDWFCNAKRAKVESGEITERTLREYIATANRMAKIFGANRLVENLGPEDFGALRADIAKTWGPHRLASEITRVRTVFKWLHASKHIATPLDFGPDFAKPSKRIMRLQRAEGPERMFERDEIHQLLDAADVQMHAMILLGVNLGFGNHDCGSLTLDLATEAIATGILDWPRPKTGVARRGWLWPETRQALQAVLDSRPAPRHPEAVDKVFVLPSTRGPWTHSDANHNNVATRFNKLQDEVGVRTMGRAFYSLRHVFRTVADETCDQVACNLVMGHSDSSMASAYRERVGGDRIERVCEHVRSWLYGDGDGDGQDDRPEQQEGHSGDVGPVDDLGGGDDGPVLLSFAMTFSLAG